MNEKKLVIAISSRAMFDMNESHQVYEEQGLAAYSEYQIAHEDEPLAPGDAFPLVSKLLALNDLLEDGNGVEIILLSRNSADTGLRVLNSVQHYEMDISRAAFCGGESPYRYIQAFGSHLFLSADASDVKNALSEGVAAATFMPSASRSIGDGPLRFAFDGDAVLFSDEAEKVYQEEGLDAFAATEQAAARRPLSGGPFKPFLAALHRLQAQFPGDDSPIRTALVTARAAPAHERVIRTLRAWRIRIDESLFLGGMPKVDFLKAYGADIFFDDQLGHCDLAAPHIATGHVPHGVINDGPGNDGPGNDELSDAEPD